MKTSRADLLDRVFPLFLERGMDGVTMGELVEASGLSKGAFYYYFPDKAGLFEACVERFFASFLPPPPGPGTGFAARVRELGAGYAAALAAARGLGCDASAYLRFVLALLPGRRTALAEALEAETDALAALALGERPGSKLPEARLAARRALALVEGCGVLVALADEADPAARFAELLADLPGGGSPPP